MATTTAQSVQGFYQNILRRTGSAADVTFWSNTVDVQGVPLSQVQNEFVTSSESMTFVLPIVQIYQTYLGRAPDSAGFTATTAVALVFSPPQQSSPQQPPAAVVSAIGIVGFSDMTGLLSLHSRRRQ